MDRVCSPPLAGFGSIAGEDGSAGGWCFGGVVDCDPLSAATLLVLPPSLVRSMIPTSFSCRDDRAAGEGRGSLRDDAAQGERGSDLFSVVRASMLLLCGMNVFVPVERRRTSKKAGSRVVFHTNTGYGTVETNDKRWLGSHARHSDPALERNRSPSQAGKTHSYTPETTII